MNKKRLLVLLLTVILALSCAWPALAAPVEKTDLAYVRFYLQNYEFFDIGDEVLAGDSIDEIMNALVKYDPYSRYMTEEQFEAFDREYDGTYVGIGVVMQHNEGGGTRLVTVYPGSGADQAGLKTGDLIVAVDGVDVREMQTNEVQALLMGEGYAGTTVKVSVLRDGQTLDFTVTRVMVDTPSVSFWMMGDYAYINVYQFTTDTADQVKAALDSFVPQGMKGVILDLRDCPGGVMSTAADTAALFTGVAPVYYTADAWGYQTFYPSEYANLAPDYDYPLAVLVNENTASASELLSASIQDWDAGLIIGTGTYGKGVYQAAVKMPSGGALYFTAGKYISSGLQDVKEQGGVTPDVLVTDATEQLNAAISWLDRQVAAAKQLTLRMGYARGTADGAYWGLAHRTFLANGQSYAPAAEVLGKLGWELHYYNGDWYGFDGNRRLILDVDGLQVVSGKHSAAIVVRDDTCYLPLSFLRHFGYQVSWDAHTRVVTVGK